MTAVFLHGVPDTPRIWGPLLNALGIQEQDVAAPSLPGFGTSLPDGFSATASGYANWFERELEKIVAFNGPVDLVGHDWGGILAWRLVNSRPDLFRSWTIIAAPIWPSYRWHLFARFWQTPLLGEITTTITPKSVAVMLLSRWGMPQDLAKKEASHVNALMRQSILSLYRSGKQIGKDWPMQKSLDKSAGLFIFAERDPFMKVTEAANFAASIEVECHIEARAGHWLIAEKPDAVAAIINRHWHRS